MVADVRGLREVEKLNRALRGADNALRYATRRCGVKKRMRAQNISNNEAGTQTA